jgi:hypothetical protein
VTSQQIDDVLHHWLVRDRRERLRPARGEWAEPRTFATSHHDGFHVEASSI